MASYVAILFWAVMTFGVMNVASRFPAARAGVWKIAVAAYGLPGYAILSLYLASRPAPGASAVGAGLGVLFLLYFLWDRSRRRD